MNRVLIAITSHDILGATGEPTGARIGDIALPFFSIEENGWDVDFVSPRGGKVPLALALAPGPAPDAEGPASVGASEHADAIERFLVHPAHAQDLETTLRPEALTAEAYAGILFAGGPGALWDFADNVHLARLASEIAAQGGLVAALGEGAAGLLSVTDQQRQPFARGRRLTARSHAEDVILGLRRVVPYVLEARLAECGAVLSFGNPFSAHVEVDGNLVTGQNEASAWKLGREMACQLERVRQERGLEDEGAASTFRRSA